MDTGFVEHSYLATTSLWMESVRYQQNPTGFWGPGTKAVSRKRKRCTEGVWSPNDAYRKGTRFTENVPQDVIHCT